ncbi:MAG: hypothetical protein ABW153_20200 [Sedimenticola sp.]
MLSLYDMATGELILQGKRNATATTSPDRRELEILCPATALQVVSTEAWPEPPTLPPELALVPAESFVEKRK